MEGVAFLQRGWGKHPGIFCPEKCLPRPRGRIPVQAYKAKNAGSRRFRFINKFPSPYFPTGSSRTYWSTTSISFVITPNFATNTFPSSHLMQYGPHFSG